MSGPVDAPDRLDSAIAAAGEEVPNATFEVRLSSGRGVALLVPLNLTPQEAIDLVGFVSVQLPRKLGEAALQRQGARMIATPRGPHLVKPA